MQVLETLINEEIRRIKKSDQFVIKYDISLIIHTPNEDIKALTISNYSIIRDYINNFSDVISITGIFGEGTINHRIIPYSKQLEATVKLKPLVNVPEYALLHDAKIKEYRLKAAIYDQSAKVVEGNSELASMMRTNDVSNIAEITFQLINPVQDKIRTQTVGTTFRDAKAIDVIRYILDTHSKINGIDKMFEVKGVDVEEGYDETVRNHIVVPHLTPVVSAPFYINKNTGGIYPTGFQYYLQRNHWYVFTPYNTKRYEKAEWTVTIINVPNGRMGQLNKTFRVTPTQLILLATGQVHYKRISDQSKMTDSHGIRFVDASKVTDGFGEVKDNKLVISRANNVNQFEQEDETNHDRYGVKEPVPIRESSNRIDTDTLNHMSDIAALKGAILAVEWENGAEDFIYPGTPIRYIYLDGKMPVQTYGRVMSVQATYRSESKGFIERKFVNTTQLICFVDDTIKSATMQ